MWIFLPLLKVKSDPARGAAGVCGQPHPSRTATPTELEEDGEGSLVGQECCRLLLFTHEIQRGYFLCVIFKSINALQCFVDFWFIFLPEMVWTI